MDCKVKHGAVVGMLNAGKSVSNIVKSLHQSITPKNVLIRLGELRIDQEVGEKNPCTL